MFARSNGLVCTGACAPKTLANASAKNSGWARVRREHITGILLLCNGLSRCCGLTRRLSAARVAAKCLRAIWIPATVGLGSDEGLDRFDAGALENQLSELFVDAECRRHAECHVREGSRGSRNHP